MGDHENLDSAEGTKRCSSCQKSLPLNAFAQAKMCCTAPPAYRNRAATRRSEPPANTRLCSTCAVQRGVDAFEESRATCTQCLSRKRKLSARDTAPGLARCSTCRKHQPHAQFGNGRGTCSSCLGRRKSCMRRTPAPGMAQCSTRHKQQPDANFGQSKTCNTCLERRKAKRKKLCSKQTECKGVSEGQAEKLVLQPSLWELQPLSGTCTAGDLWAVDEDLLEWVQTMEGMTEVDKLAHADGTVNLAGSNSADRGTGCGSGCRLSCDVTDKHLVLTLHTGRAPRITLRLVARCPWLVFALLLNSY